MGGKLFKDTINLDTAVFSRRLSCIQGHVLYNWQGYLWVLTGFFLLK